MPTPAETLLAIRGAALVNSAALDTIALEIDGWMAEVDAWAPTAFKGFVRDQLGRAQAHYRDAEREALRLVDVATAALNAIGSGGDPNTLPPGVPWSTGELQIAFGVQGKPSANRELGRYLVVEQVTWDEALSKAEAEIAATATAAVIFSTNGVEIVRFEWAAGANNAAVTVSQAVSSPGDVIVVNAPAVQDATLAAIAGTLVGRRLGT